MILTVHLHNITTELHCTENDTILDVIIKSVLFLNDVTDVIMYDLCWRLNDSDIIEQVTQVMARTWLLRVRIVPVMLSKFRTL